MLRACSAVCFVMDTSERKVPSLTGRPDRSQASRLPFMAPSEASMRPAPGRNSRLCPMQPLGVLHPGVPTGSATNSAVPLSGVPCRSRSTAAHSSARGRCTADRLPSRARSAARTVSCATGPREA